MLTASGLVSCDLLFRGELLLSPTMASTEVKRATMNRVIFTFMINRVGSSLRARFLILDGTRGRHERPAAYWECENGNSRLEEGGALQRRSSCKSGFKHMRRCSITVTLAVIFKSKLPSFRMFPSKSHTLVTLPKPTGLKLWKLACWNIIFI